MEGTLATVEQWKAEGWFGSLEQKKIKNQRRVDEYANA